MYGYVNRSVFYLTVKNLKYLHSLVVGGGRKSLKMLTVELEKMRKFNVLGIKKS